MALVLADRVKDSTTTTGQGTVTLSGTAPTGFQNFSAIGDGNTTYYTIAGGSEWEVGIGTYTSSGTTLSRDTVLASSAGGTTKVTFSAGTKDVFVTYPAERSVNLNGSALTSGRVPYATTNGLLTDAAGFTFSGTALTFPSPFTLGSTSVTTTGTQLNYLNAATGTTGTTSTNLVFSASPTFTGTLSSANQTLTTTSANALAVGRQGTTNPVLNVDASTASVVTGLNLKGAAAAGGMAVSVTSSGTNENLTIDAKGSGTVTINGTATGAITLSRATTLSAALTYGGVTLSNAVTGTGNMVLSASPTFTGTLNAATISASGSATATAFIPSGSSVPTDGMYLASTNLVSISSASTRVARFYYSGGANWAGFGAFPFIAGNANGSYPVGGFNCQPTSAGTANTYTYVSSDWASFIQYNNTIQTYTAASGTAGNTISPTQGPYVANAGTSWTNSSDARLKDQFTALSGVLEKLANIEVGSYVWSGQGQTPAGVFNIGLKAQELYAEFPEVVDKGDDADVWEEGVSKKWGIQETKVGVIALQAAKELHDKIQALEARIAILENK